LKRKATRKSSKHDVRILENGARRRRDRSEWTQEPAPRGKGDRAVDEVWEALKVAALDKLGEGVVRDEVDLRLEHGGENTQQPTKKAAVREPVEPRCRARHSQSLTTAEEEVEASAGDVEHSLNSVSRPRPNLSDLELGDRDARERKTIARTPVEMSQRPGEEALEVLAERGATVSHHGAEAAQQVADHAPAITLSRLWLKTVIKVRLCSIIGNVTSSRL
jgi:hypothetical protein